MNGANTFSAASGDYARFRPQYPPELFGWIGTQCQRREKAWDCATGNGQAALGLAPYFDSVEATDISSEQIDHAFRASNIHYSVQPAEQTGFADESFDLVTVAQALHWFDFERFWPEVRRTARPGAFFCACGYVWFECDPELQAVFMAPMLATLEPCWAAQNRILWRGYRADEIRFPFTRVEAPPFAIRVRWDIDELISHARTWSAYKHATNDPKIALAVEAVEQQARERFRCSPPFELTSPLEIAAGPVA